MIRRCLQPAHNRSHSLEQTVYRSRHIADLVRAVENLLVYLYIQVSGGHLLNGALRQNNGLRQTRRRNQAEKNRHDQQNYCHCDKAANLYINKRLNRCQRLTGKRCTDYLARLIVHRHIACHIGSSVDYIILRRVDFTCLQGRPYLIINVGSDNTLSGGRILQGGQHFCLTVTDCHLCIHAIRIDINLLHLLGEVLVALPEVVVFIKSELTLHIII